MAHKVKMRYGDKRCLSVLSSTYQATEQTWRKR